MGFRSVINRIVALSIAVAVVSGCAGHATAAAPVVHFWADGNDIEAYVRAADRCTNGASGAYRIEVQPMKLTYASNHEIVSRHLASRDRSFDIYTVDSTWMQQFALAKWLVPWTGEPAKRLRELNGPVTLAGATVGDTLLAAPLSAHTAAVVYQSSIARAPQTWDDVLATSQERTDERASRPGFGITTVDRPDTFSLFFTLASSAGIAQTQGQGLDRANETLDRVGALLQRYGSSSASLPQDATFPTTGPAGSAWGEVADPQRYLRLKSADRSLNAKWATMPRITGDVPSRSVVQQTNIAVAPASRHIEASFAAAACLTNPENQVLNMTTGMMFPTMASLYDNDAVKRLDPNLVEVERQQLADGVPMPQAPNFMGEAIAIERTVLPFASIETDGFGKRTAAALRVSGDRDLH